MRRLATGLGLLAALAGPASAATGGKLEPPDLSRYLRWGPVRVRPGFQISNLGHDDNILSGSDDEKIADYTVTLSPKLAGLVLFGPRAFLTFDERLDYTLYFENSDQSFLNQQGKARLTLPMQRIGFFTDLGWADVDFRPVDLEAVRPERRERRAGLGVILEPGWRTEVEIGGRFSDFAYTDPEPGSNIEERLDRDERATTLEVAHRVAGRTWLLLDGLLNRIDFDEPYNGIARDTRERRLMGGFELEPGGSLSGTLKLGWSRIDAEDPVLPDLSEAVGEAELGLRIAARTRLKLDGTRLPGFAVYEGNAYYVSTSAGLTALHYLTPFLGLEGRVERGRLSFPESQSGFEREDEWLRYHGGIRLRLAQNSMGRRVEYAIRIGRYRRDSNLESVEQSRTTVGIDAVVGF